MQNRIFLTFACPLKWDDLADITGEVSRRQCEKCQCSVQKVDESSIEQVEAMRTAEPGKRHCVAVEQNQGTPYLSLSEVIKTHLLDRLSPLSFLTKRVVTIALSSFLVCGSVFSAPSVSAKGQFSKDHQSYFIEPTYVLRMGEQGPPIDGTYVSRQLFNKLRIKRLRKESPDIWQSREANSFAKEFETGVISKGTVLSMANLLKRNGLLHHASAYYALYLYFQNGSISLPPDWDTASEDCDRSKEFKIIRAKGEMDFQEAGNEVVVTEPESAVFLEQLKGKAFPQDLDLFEQTRDSEVGAAQYKKAFEYLFDHYSNIEVEIPGEERVAALSRLLAVQNDLKSQYFVFNKRLKSVFIIVKLGSEPTASFECRKRCLNAIQPAMATVYAGRIHGGGLEMLVPKIHDFLLLVAKDAIEKHDKKTLTLSVSNYSTLQFCTIRFYKLSIPEGLSQTEETLFKLALENEIESLVRSDVQLHHYISNLNGGDELRRRFYSAILLRAKETRLANNIDASLRYIKAAGQFQRQYKDSCSLSDLLSEITLLQSQAKAKSKELLSYWYQEYNKQ